MKTFRRYWRIIFPVTVAIIIWWFSDMDGINSNLQSLDIAQWLGLTNTFARKLAHFILFSALGFTISDFVKGLHPLEFPNMNLVIYPIILCIIYAAIDEVHQLTVVGRSANIGDVFIDSLAGVFGTLLFVAIFCFWRRFRIRRQLREMSRRPQ